MGRRHKEHDASVYDAIGAAIRRARGDRTQTWLADAAGIDQTMVSEYELNRTRIPLDVLAKIEDALGLDGGQLLIDAGAVEARRVPTQTPTEAAIATDPRLDDGWRQMVLDFYRFGVERSVVTPLPVARREAGDERLVPDPSDPDELLLAERLKDHPDMLQQYLRAARWIKADDVAREVS